jgi:four helix bundle protein
MEEKEKEEKIKYDLEERLLNYATAIIRLSRKLNSDYAERHIGNQLLRSCSAPLYHHGEAQAAESPADFIHKLRLALKELRESERWIKLIQRADLIPEIPDFNYLLSETDQLIRIFVTSIQTAEKRRK